MANEGSEKLVLLPDATQSSYERVLEWNTQAAADAAHLAAFNIQGSVPNEHNPEDMNSFRDDMALQQHLPHSTDAFHVIGYTQWDERNRIGQTKAGFDEVSSVMSVVALLGKPA